MTLAICNLIFENYLLAKQTVSSNAICFHMLVIVFIANTVQGVSKMMAVDAHELKQLLKALARHIMHGV